jgi:hypothetical protein
MKKVERKRPRPYHTVESTMHPSLSLVTDRTNESQEGKVGNWRGRGATIPLGYCVSLRHFNLNLIIIIVKRKGILSGFLHFFIM